MNVVLTRRLPMRIAVLLAVTIFTVAMLAVGLAYLCSVRYAVADDGVIHGYGIGHHQDGVINADGIQGSGTVRSYDDGVIHGF